MNIADTEYRAFYRSKIGLLEIRGTKREVLSINFVKRKTRESAPKKKAPAVIKKCLSQLDEYFKGKRIKFSLKIRLEGTVFQKKVWRQLNQIPFGQTASYKEIAKALGNERVTRAVGGANHANPLGIIIPCHRVIGKNGKLVGYGAGLWRKKWLLKHEKDVSFGKDSKRKFLP